MRTILLGVSLTACAVEAPEPVPAPEPVAFPLPQCEKTHCTTVECPDGPGVCVCHWPPARDILCEGEPHGDETHTHTHGEP